MSTDQNIDDLLKEDEARLRAKRKRLSTFSKTLDEARSAQQKATESALEILDAGDLSRADFAKVFQLSKNERAILVPAQKRSGAQSAEQISDTESEPDHASGQQYKH